MADQSELSSRAIMGMYFARLEQDDGMSWLMDVSNMFNSDQESETYKFLGQSPAMREWLSSRQAKSFRGNGVTILNRHYESTIEVDKSDARRDKTPQIRARMNEWTDRAQTHWASLVSTLIVNGASTLCYDGQNFFDTTHSEGDSGTQSNMIDADISTYPVEVHGSTTAPSKEEAMWAMIKGITQIASFKDDRGEPMNENARSFLVMTPIALYPAFQAAISPLLNVALGQNLNLSEFDIRVRPNVRLDTASWTDKFVVFRTDSPIKALIRQTEQETELKAKAEGSEFEFDNDAWQFGIDNWRGAGYGYPQRACHVTMI